LARPRNLRTRTPDDSLEGFFARLPALLGRMASPSERVIFERYADLLLVWNRTHRLTAAKTRATVGQGLFLDSLLFRALLPPSPARIADVGAGAGIPGLPLRIVDPEVRLTMIDSRRKPVSFLRTLTRELGLSDVDVEHGRVEELAEHAARMCAAFDVVLSRSVRLEHALLEASMRLLKPHGIFVASGPPPNQPAPEIRWPGVASWKTISFESLGIERRFFIATPGLDQGLAVRYCST